jgi:hypothetical protein
MTAAEYQDWVYHHSTLFALGERPGDVDRFLLWKPQLDQFTLDELISATNRLLASGRKIWPDDHVASLQREVRAMRMEWRKENSVMPAQGGQCRLCGGCSVAVVAVPHPSCVVNGAWVYPFYTVAVACICESGVRFSNRQRDQYREAPVGKKGLLPTLTLENYERGNPGWQQMMERRELELTEVRKLAMAAPVREALAAPIRQAAYAIAKPAPLPPPKPSGSAEDTRLVELAAAEAEPGLLF